MATATIELETADGPMPAFEAIPEVRVRGGILVVQEAFGVTSHIEGVAEWLAASGWRAVAPALFHRQGSPVLAYDDFERVRPLMGQLTGEGLAMDLDAGFDHLRAAGIEQSKLGVVGFCMGGFVALFAGSREPLGAAVSFYGGGVVEGRFGLPPLAELAPTLLSPWLGRYGDLDQGIPVEQVEILRAAAARAKVPTELVRYADADHGFNCDDRPAVFAPEAAADARKRTLAWFDLHLHPEDD